MIRSVRNYFTSAVAELSKVVWPTRREVINHTLIIAVSVIIAVMILGLVDYGLTILLRKVILNEI